MKFSLNKISEIERYTSELLDRVSNAHGELASMVQDELINSTPKRSGAAAASWNISENYPNYSFSISKTSPDRRKIKPETDSPIYIATRLSLYE
jgi:hypothetical protein